MAFIYGISDIHGFYGAMEEALKLVDLSCEGSKLIFCGDYIDYGIDSCKTLYNVKEWTEKYPNQVYALMGNHEQMFLDYLCCTQNDIWNYEWLGADKGFSTVYSFVTQDTIKEIETLRRSHTEPYSFLTESSKVIKSDIAKNHGELLKWLKAIPYYFETENQIFVHAGIDEEAEEYWKYGTTHEYFTGKYPATFGKFYKDIIAGHISTSSLAHNKDFHDIFWDRKSHYYIDGTVNISGYIPVLKYDTDKGKYFSFKRHLNHESGYVWEEYSLK